MIFRWYGSSLSSPFLTRASYSCSGLLRSVRGEVLKARADDRYVVVAALRWFQRRCWSMAASGRIAVSEIEDYLYSSLGREI